MVSRGSPSNNSNVPELLITKFTRPKNTKFNSVDQTCSTSDQSLPYDLLIFRLLNHFKKVSKRKAKSTNTTGTILHFVAGIFFPLSVSLKRTKVIIVGAGIAGLAAAHTLAKAGILNFKVLEAQSEPGGRIKSWKFKEGHLELGAQWIHGSANTFYHFVLNRGLLSSSVSYEGQGLYLRRGGEKVPVTLENEVREIVGNILTECENFYKLPKNSKDISLGQYLKSEFESYLKTCNNDSPSTLKVKQELFDWHLRFQIIDNSCRNLEDMSALSWGRYQSCGPDNLNLKHNYSNVLKRLIAELPDNSVICKRPVSSIEWGECIKVRCTAPDHDAEYLADHLIVTCSVGYINANKYSLFRPPLPEVYLEGFESIGFGTINKIFLYYEDSWWNDMEGIQLVWDSLRDELQTDLEKELSWTRGVTGFDLVLGLPTVLLCWVGGIGAELVETLSDNQVAQHCTILLKLFTGTEVPLPTEIVRSKWNSNEYIGGSYSYLPVRRDKEDVKVAPLLSPICIENNGDKVPRIFFAGEALHPSHYSTVHGAFATGTSQATKLIDYIKSQ